MSQKKVTLLGASMLVLLGATGVAAQEAVLQPIAAVDTDEVVVIGERVARGNNVINAEQIEALPAGQNIVDAIKLVPGVSIRGSDALNNDPWTYAINIRGFEVNQRSSKIGQTLDGVPLFNGSY